MESHQLTDDQLDDLFRQAAAKIIHAGTYQKAWMRLKARLDKPVPIVKRMGKKRY